MEFRIVQPRIKGMDQRKYLLQKMNEGCLLQSLMNDKIAGDYIAALVPYHRFRMNI